MNIFVLDDNPVTAAQQQVDKHVVKMPLESAQMLCSALIRYGSTDTPYRQAHKNHPCTLWAGDTRTNFNWLITHGIALCEEYTSRYGRRHKSQDVIEWCATQSNLIPQGVLTPHAQAMPVQYKSDCAVASYRDYYHGEKAYIANWKQNKPDWWSPNS
jgi:hypothetical protein